MRKMFLILGTLLCVALLLVAWWFNLWPFVGRIYTMEDLGMKVVKSAVDFNENGVDDYRDFLLGARKDAENFPKYDGSYVQGGYRMKILVYVRM